MTTNSDGLAMRPSHVPAELVRDFDLYHPLGASGDVHAAWVALQDGPPIVWTPRNGGHWIGTRAVDLMEMQTNWGLFSYTSVNIPRNPTPSLPLESDPPLHTALRSIISPLFTPDTLNRVERLARELTISLIEGLKPRGYCEFKSEFALHLPIVVFLKLVDLPLEGRAHLLKLVEKRVRSSVAEERNAAKAGLLAYMRDAIAERRTQPGQDFISRILHATVQGRPLSDFEAENVLTTVLSGGLDTVASMLGFVMAYLARHPDQRARLARDRSVIPRAVDELIRRHGLANTARLITRDAVFRGVSLKKGEQIIVPSALIGLDPEMFPRPLEVDFDRPNPGRHGSFGNGIHRCPGANLGRLEIRVVLEEWLARIPEFNIDPRQPVVTASGLVCTMTELHLAWPQ